MAAFTYEYRVKGLQKVSAQIAGEVCEQLTNSETGLTAKSLLDASRAEDAPLHGEFEWDDGIAAEKYRTEQANGIIRNIRIVTVVSENENQMERGFVSIKRNAEAYVPIHIALTHEDMKNSLLGHARNDMEAFIAKYQRLEELAAVLNPMREYLRKVG